MGMTVERAIARVEGSLGGRLPTFIGRTDLINAVGSFLVSLYPWRWLENQLVELTFDANSPFIRLPLNFPSDIRDIISVEAADSLVNSVRFTSWADMMRLATYGLQNETFHHSLLVTYRPATIGNLLQDTERFDPATTAWTTGGSLTVADKQAKNPRDGAQTMALISDVDAGIAASVKQTIDSWTLPGDGRYQFDIFLRKDTALKSNVQIKTRDSAGGTSLTEVNVDWTTDPPTFTQIDTGLGAHASVTQVLNEQTVRVGVQADHSHGGTVTGDGSIRCLLHPEATSSAQGSVYAWGSNCRRIEQAVAAAGYPLFFEDYEPVFGSKFPKGGEPIPVLLAWPVPTAATPQKIVIAYRGGWPRVDDDFEVIAIPSWLDSWFIEGLLAFARGWVEEDKASLSERISSTLVGPFDRFGQPANLLLRSAMLRDLEQQGDWGTIQGGAVFGNYVVWDWGFSSDVSGPATS